MHQHHLRSVTLSFCTPTPTIPFCPATGSHPRRAFTVPRPSLFSTKSPFLSHCLESRCGSSLPGELQWVRQQWKIVSVSPSDASPCEDRLAAGFGTIEAPTLNTSAGMSYALQASLLTRMDLGLLKLSQWPRMVASRIEEAGVSKLTQLELEQLMLTTLRAEPSILGIAVGFEPVS
jgi:hypothetical protein